MLESLPAQDILFPLILSHVSPSDLFSIRSCSRTLHHLVTVYVTINRSLDLGYQKRLTQAAFQILTEGATSLRHLNLAGLKFLTDDLLRPVLIQCPHLLSLELSECHHLTSGILQTLSSRSVKSSRISSFQFSITTVSDPTNLRDWSWETVTGWLVMPLNIILLNKDSVKMITIWDNYHHNACV